MASGHLCIEFAESSSWDGFAIFVERLIARIGGVITAKVNAVETKIWTLKHSDCELRVVFDDYPSQVSLESPSEMGDIVMQRIADTLGIPDSPCSIPRD